MRVAPIRVRLRPDGWRAEFSPLAAACSFSPFGGEGWDEGGVPRVLSCPELAARPPQREPPPPLRGDREVTVAALNLNLAPMKVAPTPPRSASSGIHRLEELAVALGVS